MAVQRRTRLALRIVGVACLLVGLCPYYSYTSQPSVNTANPQVQSPGPGVSVTRSSTTTFGLGLPFSPLYRQTRIESFTTTSPGDSSERSTGFMVMSEAQFQRWSTAVAGTGFFLLVVSLLMRGRRPVASPVDGAIGTGTDVGA
jgi:hypothetical protein